MNRKRTPSRGAQIDPIHYLFIIISRNIYGFFPLVTPRDMTRVAIPLRPI
nr:MAG TPA: hypothetical protein [Caudoviricetes sp.]